MPQPHLVTASDCDSDARVVEQVAVLADIQARQFVFLLAL